VYTPQKLFDVSDDSQQMATRSHFKFSNNAHMFQLLLSDG